jgi:hypothetical protein
LVFLQSQPKFLTEALHQFVILTDPFSAQLTIQFWRFAKMVSQNAPAQAIPRLEHRHFPAVFRQQMSGSEPGEAGSYHDAAFRIHVFTIP